MHFPNFSERRLLRKTGSGGSPELGGSGIPSDMSDVQRYFRTFREKYAGKDLDPEKKRKLLLESSYLTPEQRERLEAGEDLTEAEITNLKKQALNRVFIAHKINTRSQMETMFRNGEFQMEIDLRTAKVNGQETLVITHDIPEAPADCWTAEELFVFLNGYCEKKGIPEDLELHLEIKDGYRTVEMAYDILERYPKLAPFVQFQSFNPDALLVAKQEAEKRKLPKPRLTFNYNPIPAAFAFVTRVLLKETFTYEEIASVEKLVSSAGIPKPLAEGIRSQALKHLQKGSSVSIESGQLLSKDPRKARGERYFFYTGTPPIEQLKKAGVDCVNMRYSPTVSIQTCRQIREAGFEVGFFNIGNTDSLTAFRAEMVHASMMPVDQIISDVSHKAFALMERETPESPPEEPSDADLSVDEKPKIRYNSTNTSQTPTMEGSAFERVKKGLGVVTEQIRTAKEEEKPVSDELLTRLQGMLQEVKDFSAERREELKTSIASAAELVSDLPDAVEVKDELIDTVKASLEELKEKAAETVQQAVAAGSAAFGVTAETFANLVIPETVKKEGIAGMIQTVKDWFESIRMSMAFSDTDEALQSAAAMGETGMFGGMFDWAKPVVAFLLGGSKDRKTFSKAFAPQEVTTVPGGKTFDDVKRLYFGDKKDLGSFFKQVKECCKFAAGYVPGAPVSLDLVYVVAERFVNSGSFVPTAPEKKAAVASVATTTPTSASNSEGQSTESTESTTETVPTESPITAAAMPDTVVDALSAPITIGTNKVTVEAQPAMLVVNDRKWQFTAAGSDVTILKAAIASGTLALEVNIDNFDMVKDAEIAKADLAACLEHLRTEDTNFTVTDPDGKPTGAILKLV